MRQKKRIVSSSNREYLNFWGLSIVITSSILRRFMLKLTDNINDRNVNQQNTKIFEKSTRPILVARKENDTCAVTYLPLLWSKQKASLKPTRPIILLD